MAVTIRVVADHTEKVAVAVDGVQIVGDPGVTITASSGFALHISGRASAVWRSAGTEGEALCARCLAAVPRGMIMRCDPARPTQDGLVVDFTMSCKRP